jgi:hypothetical protein
MGSKVKVNGNEATPLFKYLKSRTGGKPVKWNFAKFLVNKKGQVCGGHLVINAFCIPISMHLLRSTQGPSSLEEIMNYMMTESPNLQSKTTLNKTLGCRAVCP